MERAKTMSPRRSAAESEPSASVSPRTAARRRVAERGILKENLHVRGSLRWHCWRLTKKLWFERLIFIAIVANCMFLATDSSPEDPSEVHKQSEWVFLALFGMELLIKQCAYGPRQYLVSHWNKLDCVIVIAGCIEAVLIALAPADLGPIRLLRVFRVLRPLRTLPRLPKVRVVVTALVSSLDLLSRAFMLFAFFLVMYAVMGVQLFRGELSLHDGMTNFDNFGSALLAVVNLLTLDNWQDLLYDMGESVLHLLFLCSMVFIGVFFMLNITITILKSQYVAAKIALRQERLRERKRRLRGAARMLTLHSRNSSRGRRSGTSAPDALSGKATVATSFSRTQPSTTLAALKAAAAKAPAVAPSSGRSVRRDSSHASNSSAEPRNKYDKFVRHKIFERSIIFCILVNTVMLAIETPYDTAKFQEVARHVNIVLTSVFIVECILKHMAFGWKLYWASWNAFDGIIVFISVIELGLASSGSIGGLRVMRVFRMLRVLRVARLGQFMGSFQRVLHVFVVASEEFGIILILLAMFLTMFSITGVQFFSGKLVPYTGETIYLNGTVEEISCKINFNYTKPYTMELVDFSCLARFDSFFDSFVIVFQLLTMEDWVPIMFTVVRRTNFGAVLFFHICIFLGTFIILELFLAVLLGTFEQIFTDEKRKRQLMEKNEERRSIALMQENKRKQASSESLDPGAAHKTCDGDTSTRVAAIPRTPPPAALQLLESLRRSNPELAAMYERSPVYCRVLGLGFERGIVNRSTSRPSSPAGSYKLTSWASPSQQLKVVSTQKSLAPAASVSSPRADAAHIRATINNPSSPQKPADLLVPPPIAPNIVSNDVVGKARQHESSAHSQARPKLRVIHAFDGKGARELCVARGDVVEQCHDNDGHDGWILVARRTQQTDAESMVRGFVPASYVQPVLETAAQLHREAKEEQSHGQAESMPDAIQVPPPKPLIEAASDGAKVADHRAPEVAQAESLESHQRVESHAVESRSEDKLPASGAPALGARGRSMSESPAHQVTRPSLARAVTMSPDERHSVHMRCRNRAFYVEYEGVQEVLKLHRGVQSGHNMVDDSGAAPTLREKCRAALRHNMFEGFIMVIIIASSICLALESPRASQELKDGLQVADYVFLAIFTLEEVMKIAAFRFISGKEAYLRDMWNRLDFFIVSVGQFTFIVKQFKIFESSGVAFLMTLRMLRLLRPLRAVRRFMSLRIVVEAVISCALPALNVFLALALMAMVFGIIGVGLFGGRFGYCSLDARPGSSKIECERYGGTWIRPVTNFDNCMEAFYSLFVVSTLDGWVQVMNLAIHANTTSTDTDIQPSNGREDSRRFYAIYFILWICVGVWVGINLIIGVVCDHFSRMRDTLQGSVFLTDDQRKWLRALELARAAKPVRTPRKPERSWLRAKCFDVVEHPWFDRIVMVAIFANTFVLACAHKGQTETFCVAMETANVVFMVLFMLEAGLKLGGLGRRAYFQAAWNRFDFVLVLISVADFLYGAITTGGLKIVCRDSETETGEDSDASRARSVVFMFRVFKVFRISRLLRLLRAKELRSIIFTIIYSLPSLFNVGCMILLVTFIFAIVGMNLFGDFADGSNDSHADFSSFASSMLMMFRVATYEDWTGIQAGCRDNIFSEPSVTRLFFGIYIVLVNLIMLKLFVAVMVENFDMLFGNAGKTRNFNATDISNFVDNWAKYDPQATHYIEVKHLALLLKDLDPPFGVGRLVGRGRVLTVIQQLEVAVIQDKVEFNEVLYKLVRRGFGTELSIEGLAKKVLSKVPDESTRHKQIALVVQESHEKQREHEEVNLDVRESSIVSLDNGITTTRLHVAALKIQTFARIVILKDEDARRRDSDLMFCNAVALLAEKRGLKFVAQSARNRQRHKHRASKAVDAEEQGNEAVANGQLHAATGANVVV